MTSVTQASLDPARRATPVPGVVFAGQGSAPSAVLNSLAAHRDHWLVREFAERLPCSIVDGLDLADTRVAQPATYVAGLVAALVSLPEREAVPLAVGHSLGELTALAYAGVLTPLDGLRLAFERGEICHAVHRRRPGAMAALHGLAPDDAEWLRRQVVAETGGVLDVAAVNGPRQMVLAGDRAAVHALVKRYRSTARGGAVVLSIGGGFHSALMVDALPRWGEALRSLRLEVGRTTVVSCIDGRVHEDPEDFRELLLRALVLPVRWGDVLTEAARIGARTLWEAGPGRSLQRLARGSGEVDFLDSPSGTLP